jgi:hypothetical protein
MLGLNPIGKYDGILVFVLRLEERSRKIPIEAIRRFHSECDPSQIDFHLKAGGL